MPPSRGAWASAFALQSQSDWQVYNLLAGESLLADCHELHYLQMACEKIAKAYRCRDTDADLEDLLKRHIGFAKFMSSFLASPGIQEAYKGRSAQLREISRLSLLTSAGGRTLLKLVDRAIQDFES